ncbi:hypothetical protein BB934_23960 [Microvirga ossetica]|uniref:Uncharacterized protein n=1 Tax=Microvirga ossetica TaxID=1882682 RepID=A0A1B2ELP5_9HYPH|nr:hypothetical protein [Microvirga ossetica]ANY80906.1 hypothetical protein BB934_23960 [Microvirga ossetica]
MPVKRRASNLVLVVGLLLVPGIALAQDATPKPHVPLEKSIGQTTPTGPVPSLAVLNAAGAKLEGGKLILTGVAPNSIVFADRPVRAAGHVMTEQFIMQWDEGKDSFAKDPPNATVSVLGGDGSKVSDAVVTLKTPKLEGGNLTFDVVVLEGGLAGSSGPAALFIDRFGGFGGGGFHAGGFGGFRAGGFGGFHAGGFHAGGFDAVHVGGYRGGAWAGGNYWHAPVYRGAWYGAGAGAAAGLAAGAALGAAAAAPYYYGYGRCGYYPYPPCY